MGKSVICQQIDSGKFDVIGFGDYAQQLLALRN
jgi:hypothetical protein